MLTSVLTAKDYFFRCQKSIFNLENKCIPQETFFVYTSQDLLTPDLIFELRTSQLHIQERKGIGKIQFVSKLRILQNL